MNTRASARLVAALAVLLWLAAPALGALELKLGDHDFVWTSVEEDRARFSWWAEVENDTARAFDVEVVLELLDEADQLVHSDSATVTMAANTTSRATQEGSMDFDRAADVATFRFRLDPRPPEERSPHAHASDGWRE